MSIDLNMIIEPLLLVTGVASAAFGMYLSARLFLRFRFQVAESIQMDVAVIKVSRPRTQQNEAPKTTETWKEEVQAMEQLLSTLATLRVQTGWRGLFFVMPNIVFEIANPSSSEEIFFYVSVPRVFRETVEKQIHGLFPQAVIEPTDDYTIFSPQSEVALAQLQLVHSAAYPIRTFQQLSADPLGEMTNAISKLETVAEGAAIQFVLAPATKNWRRLSRSVAKKMQEGQHFENIRAQEKMLGGAGKAIGQSVATVLRSRDQAKMDEKKPVVLTPQEQDLVKAIDGKANKAAFRVNIRLVASALTKARAQEILAQMENTFAQFENSEVNRFRVGKRLLVKSGLFDYIFRNFDPDHAMTLGVEEVASLFHFPTTATETPKIKWLKAGVAAPPVNVPKEGMLLGYNDYRGVQTDIRITDTDRRRHMYVIGQTGVGKSNFLQEMAKKDAKNGRGFCFVDPHGDAINDILTAIPRERAEDVIIFDPADVERPIGLNMLEYDPQHPEQQTFIINEMIGIFDQLYDLKQTGGPMFEQYMRNAMQLVMSDPESGSTLLEISKVLADEDFRRAKLARCSNQVVRDFWLKEAEKAGGDAALANMVPYITSKLTSFISNDIMRPIIAQQKSAINFRDIMDNNKILLIQLSKGKIGEINARLLGMIFVGKILMAALSRVDTPENERKDFYLYLDEFQNVTTTSIAQVLSEARKYRLCLVLAHQFIGQLKEEISKAVFGNVGSLVAFRVGPEDGEFLEKQFEPVFRVNDLVNVDNYHAFARLLMNNELTKPFNLKTFPPTQGDQEVANALKELSRLRFGRDANIVNREILARTHLRTES